MPIELRTPRQVEEMRPAGRFVAEWRVLPGVGHLPMIDEPETVARTILDWAATH